MTKASDLSQLPAFIEANTTNLIVNATSYTIGSSFIANTTAVVSTGYANVTTSVNSALLTVGSNFIANTSGAYHTGAVNAASFTVGSNFIANSTALTTVSNTATIGTAAYVVANGNVGIGTNTPAAKLDIKGLSRSSMGTGTGAGGAGYAFYQFGTSATATENWHIGSEGDGSFRLYNQGLGAGLERLRVESSGSVSTTSNSVTFGTAAYVVANGNVGIGTSSPNNKLALMASGSAVGLTLTINNSYTTAAYVTNDSTYIKLGSSVGATGDKLRVALAAPDNAVTINSAGNTGIGVSSPAHKLDVSGNVNIGNTNVYHIGNTAVLYKVTSPDGGYVWLTQDTTFSMYGHDIRAPKPANFVSHAVQTLFTSYDLNNGSPYGDAIHLNSYSDSTGGDPNIILINKGTNGVKVARGGWANSTTPSSTQYSSGSVYTLNFTSASDASVKENVQNITNGIDIVKQLRPVTYEWTDEYILAGFSKNSEEQSFDENGRLLPPTTKVRNVGLIAQEVKEVLPTIVHSNNVSLPGTEEYLLNVSYDKIVPHLIAAVKEQQAMIEQMQLEINALKNQT